MKADELGRLQGEHRSGWDLLAALCCLAFVAYVMISALTPLIVHAGPPSSPRSDAAAVTRQS